MANTIITVNPLSTLSFAYCSTTLFCYSNRRSLQLSSCSCSVSNQASVKPISPLPKRISISTGDEQKDKDRLVCPGCGIFMQDTDPNLLGYFKKSPSRPAADFDDDEILGSEDLIEEDIGEVEYGLGSKSDLGDKFQEFDLVSSDDDLDVEGLEDENQSRKEIDGFAPAGIGYGNITEETLAKFQKEKVSKAEKKHRAREAKQSQAAAEDAVVVCARCHSLRNYGQVKNQKAENLIPDFDFDRFVASKLMKPAASGAPVVVMVVDCVDFDGSFPKRAAKSLFRALDDGKSSKASKVPKLVLVATKVDLLPSQVSPSRLDRWVRTRAKAAGASKLHGVYSVSARKDLGVRNLLAFIKEIAGPRGNVWVVGAQNAGKSTLINAFAKKEGAKLVRLTEASVPGTTLGILRVTGVLPAKAKMYDTPGLLHPYLLSMRLNREEQKMVEIRKELQPHTYRMKVGQTVHVGGLGRLDLTQASVDTIYITIWASPNISLHMGKIENADDLRTNHIGIRLQPPIGKDRASELGDWICREIKVSGSSWDANCSDIAISGLGWFSLAMKGEAALKLWTYDGIEVTQREPLVLDRAPFLERPGFWLPKAISDSIGNSSKMENKKLKRATADFLLEARI